MNTMQRPGAVEPGDIAPNFVLPDEAGRRIELDADAVAGHFTVLIFFGGSALEAARLQLASFAAAAPSFETHAATLFGVGRPGPAANAAAPAAGRVPVSLPAPPAGTSPPAPLPP